MSNINVKEMMIRRRGLITLPGEMLEKSDVNPTSIKYLYGLMEEMNYQGYKLDDDALKVLACAEPDDVVEVYNKVTDTLKELSGDNVEYEPMYKNYPEDVINMSSIDYLVDQLRHYMFYGVYPEETKKARELLDENINYKELHIGTLKDEQQVYSNLLASSVSYSAQDIQDINSLVAEIKRNPDPVVSIKAVMPGVIPNKENMMYVTNLLYNENLFSKEDMIPYYKTATDVLRLFKERREDSVSKSVPRADRKLYMTLLSKCGNVEQDMNRNIGQWKTFAQLCHPQEFKDVKLIEIFDKLYHNNLKKTFAAQIDEALKNKNVNKVVSLLEKRPGEFLRRIDNLITKYPKETDIIIEGFKKSISEDGIEPKLLLSVAEHFKHRSEKSPLRSFAPKGGTTKTFVTYDNRTVIPKEVCDKIIDSCNDRLREHFSMKRPLGKVYIDPNIDGYKVPMVQRNVSEGKMSPARGSHINIDKSKDIMRTFIWWTNDSNENRVDVDLSLQKYDENFKSMGAFYYGNAASEKSDYQVSSGDITNGEDFGGKGVAEFLDFDINELNKHGVRYVAVVANVYTEQSFNKFPCKFGFMQREEMNKGEIFEPSTVTERIDLSNKSSYAIPVIFDCQEREYIWADLTQNIDAVSFNVCQGEMVNFSSAYSIVNNESPELMDLLKLHVEARGELVNNKEEADVIFGEYEGITPCQADIILGDLLAKDMTKEDIQYNTEKTFSEEMEKRMYENAFFNDNFQL